MVEKLLEVKDLKTYFYTSDGVVPAVDGVTFHINKGETVGMVGESGCGKSVTSLSVMRLIPVPPGRIESGQIFFKGRDLVDLSKEEMRKIRGSQISMIFQEPMSSLNPVHTVGRQISESIQLHLKASKSQAMKKTIDLLCQVGIPMPERRINEYPHQLSGGMRQRVMIAIALSCNPHLLIADEPTTALDVTIQAQILELLKSLKKLYDMSILIITHDLGVVADMADRVVVMYGGKVVEEAGVRNIFKDPRHPYTWGLLESIPRIKDRKDKLHVIEGAVPNPASFPSGCRFHPRCKYREDICSIQDPPMVGFDTGRRVSCWLAQKSLTGEVRQ